MLSLSFPTLPQSPLDAVDEVGFVPRIAPDEGATVRRTIQLHWPEGNILLTRCHGPISREPNFKAFGDVTRVP
jgi:hypothetical protein